jgi:hypothetical protein
MLVQLTQTCLVLNANKQLKELACVRPARIMHSSVLTMLISHTYQNNIVQMSPQVSVKFRHMAVHVFSKRTIKSYGKIVLLD